jgi:hypothetical protein
MENLKTYRDLIKRYIREYVDLFNRQPKENEETFSVFDEESDNYLCMTLGWDERKRVKYTTLHARIRNNKIYIEEDWTEDGIANMLVREGVPQSDIVLAFHSPKMREFTDFAAA